MFQSRDFYTHEFIVEGNVVASTFVTKTGTQYRAYFYPAAEYIPTVADDMEIYKNGYFFGFTKTGEKEDLKEAFDRKIRQTIVNIVSGFYQDRGIETILLFHCSDDWGKEKKYLRAKRFDEWFKFNKEPFKFLKFNEELIIYENTEIGTATDKEYLSVIVEETNPKAEKIKEEFYQLKETIVFGKEQG